MPRHRRFFPKNKVFAVTNRTAEGLPFLSCVLMNLFLFGILARARFCNPGVTICAFLFMGNHYHGILITNGNAEDFIRFMNFVDGEIGRLINRLRGVSGINVWHSRYAAQPLLTPGNVIEQMVYIYLNPVTAGLVSSISQYPGASTWQEFTTGIQRRFRFFGSAGIARLPKGALSESFARKFVKEVLQRRPKLNKLLLPIEPFAWLKCFEESQNFNPEDVKQEILQKIAEEEEKLKQQREASGEGVVGVQRLQYRCFHSPFRPKKWGIRALCISSCELARENFTLAYRSFVERCREVWRRWKLGELHLKLPPGAFIPPRAPLASLLPLEEFG